MKALNLGIWVFYFIFISFLISTKSNKCKDITQIIIFFFFNKTISCFKPILTHSFLSISLPYLIYFMLNLYYVREEWRFKLRSPFHSKIHTERIPHQISHINCYRPNPRERHVLGPRDWERSLAVCRVSHDMGDRHNARAFPPHVGLVTDPHLALRFTGTWQWQVWL
jgi:hypothetical protein